MRSTRWLGVGMVVGVATAVAAHLPLRAVRAQDAPAADEQVVDASYVAPDGTRVLRQSIVVPATPAEVWATWTTAEGWKSFAVPVAHVEFRLGGIIETSYRPGAAIGDPANIKNRILSYLPLRMVSFQAIQAPPGFSNPEILPHLFTVVEIEALGERRVRVTVSGVGYATGEGFDRLYTFFERGNAFTLWKLRQRFASGPVDWAKELAGRGR